MKSIGIVGLGIMGQGMATNFLKKGHKVFVWNRTKSAADKFKKKGAIVCNNPSEVAQNAEIVFEVTANDISSRKVWLAKNGILVGATRDSILITSATLSIRWIDKLISACKKNKLTFLDIPLTGGRIGAETGNLTLLSGGDKKILKSIEKDLKSIAGKIYHFGPQGHGMRYKLILNFLQASHIIAFGQAMKIASANKMDLKKVSESLADRPGGVITGIAQKTYFLDPNPVTFSIEWITKDLTYANLFAENLNLSILKDVLREYKMAVDAGYSNKDWASINKLIK